MKEKSLAVLSLFASTSTLFCCALPTLLVTLGLGAVVAGAVSSLPWLVPLSRHKHLVFATAGVLIAINWVLIRRSRGGGACTIDQASGESACDIASRFSRRMLWLSTALYAVGFTMAFVALPVGRLLRGYVHLVSP